MGGTQDYTKDSRPMNENYNSMSGADFGSGGMPGMANNSSSFGGQNNQGHGLKRTPSNNMEMGNRSSTIGHNSGGMEHSGRQHMYQNQTSGSF